MNEEELPEGWALKPIVDLFKMSGGGTPLKSQSSYWGGSIPWLSSGDIKSTRIATAIDFITKEGLENSSAKLCEPGTVILVVRSGILKHTLPVAVLDIPAAINQDIRALDSGNREMNEWLALALRSFAPQILEENREGTTVQSVKTETIQAFELPIPPLAEQQRIVAAVERALAKVNAARDRLARVPATLKRFRQAVLAAACSGRLTADWRKPNAIDIVLEGEDGIEFPESWQCRLTAELIEAGTVISYGIVLPGPNLPEGVPYIRGMDIDDSGRIQVDALWRTSPEIAAKHKRAEVRAGDVLLCVIRNLRVAIVPPGIDGANLTQGTVRMRPSEEILGP